MINLKKGKRFIDILSIKTALFKANLKKMIIQIGQVWFSMVLNDLNILPGKL